MFMCVYHHSVLGTELTHYAPNSYLEFPDNSEVTFDSEFLPQATSLEEPLFQYVESVLSDDKEKLEKSTNSLNDSKLPVNLTLTDELDLLLSPQNSLKEFIQPCNDKEKSKP